MRTLTLVLSGKRWTDLREDNIGNQPLLQSMGPDVVREKAAAVEAVDVAGGREGEVECEYGTSA